MLQYCFVKGVDFPPNDSVVLSDFLCSVADSSSRPRSQLKTVEAACSALYNILGLHNPLQSFHVHSLVTALVKSSTGQPREPTKVLPIQAFKVLFEKWGNNDQLSLSQLRMKAITLLSLFFMSRPSDLAPNGVMFDPETLSVSKLQFTRNQIKFLDDGSMSVTFHGIKNDTDRSGFVCQIPPATESVLDPVSCLSRYLAVTDSLCQQEQKPVFISLRKPYGALSSSAITSILNNVIKEAGLSSQGYSAKCFRPTGATAAVYTNWYTNCDPETAMQTGRWKTRSVFFEHYVHNKPPVDYCNKILSFK